MAVDIESLSTPQFLELLRYEGNPPPGAEYDAIRMTPQEWAELFPGAVQHEGGGADAGVPEPATASV
jgi:hypothetical protein